MAPRDGFCAMGSEFLVPSTPLVHRLPFQLPPLRESDIIYMPTYTRPHRTGGPWCDAMLQAVGAGCAPGPSCR